MHIGYVSSGKVIGISKLARIAEMFVHRLQIQARLTKDVADAIMEILNPFGVMVVMESRHLCMGMRGAKKPGAITVTSCVLGSFKKEAGLRNEFRNSIAAVRDL